MASTMFFWKSGAGAVKSAEELTALGITCSACQVAELAPLGADDHAPPAVHGVEPRRLFVCGACQAVVPLEIAMRGPGFQVIPGPPRLTGEDRKHLLAAMEVAFKESHHPWRQLLEREAKLPDFRLGELPDLRKALSKPGDMGGGVACPGCSKKPLDPLPDPAQESAFAARAGVVFVCSGCGQGNRFVYGWDAAGGALSCEVSRIQEETQLEAASFCDEAQARLGGGDQEGFWKLLRQLPPEVPRDLPGVARLIEAGRIAGGANPPEGIYPSDELRPLLRRLGAAGPLFSERSWAVTCLESPRLRLRGSSLRTLVQDLQSKAQKQGPASILEDIARWNFHLPFLVKTPPILKLLGPALLDLRRILREEGVHLLPVACREGILLIDPLEGAVHHRLPHMQASSVAPPVALGFMNKMVYYQEPGVLSVTGHPLVEGTAWRTDLDGPVRRWVDLGRYTVVETEAGLSELSGRSGRVRWTRTREELGGLLDWSIASGAIMVAGAEGLFLLDPASGEVTESEALPKRATLLKLVHGSLPPPAAVVDQGYGPGIFAPKVEEFKGGVKPIATPSEGSEDLAFVACDGSRVYSAWESELGYAPRAVVAGPLEKKFEARTVAAETEMARYAGLCLRNGGDLALLPGRPVLVVDTVAGEERARIEVDARLGLREFKDVLLALGEDSLSALDPEGGRVRWTVATPGLQAIDIPGPHLAPAAARPGHQEGDSAGEEGAASES